MIVVTGATGTIGHTLIRLLSERGADVIALSRNPPGDEPLPGVTWVAADLADGEALPAIFAGAERLFLLTGNVGNMVPLQKNAIDAAGQAGVKQVVKLSALGASDHSQSVIGVWHYIVEQHLKASGLEWTILRPHVFMQNLLDQQETIRREGRVYSPSGEAEIPMIDTRDIAAVAAATLTEPGHVGMRYTLTGPEALSYQTATEILAETLNRPLIYIPETEDMAWKRLHGGAGLPPWLVGAQLTLAAYQRQGGGTDILTDAIEQVTGVSPRTFRRFAQDFAPAFQGSK